MNRRRRKRRLILLSLAMLTLVLSILGFFRYARLGKMIIHYPYITFMRTNLYRLSPKVTEVTIQLVELPLNTNSEAPTPNIDVNQIRRFSNIHPGDPLFFLPLTKILDRLAEISEFENVAIRRQLNGRVVIELKLRQPVAMIVGLNNQQANYYTDAQGFVFVGHAFDQQTDLPVISGLSKDWNVITPERRRIVLAALELIDRTQAVLKDHHQLLSEVHIDMNEGFSLFTDKIGGKILFGLPPYETKISRLNTLLQHLEGRLGDVEWLDLDYNNKAFVKFKHQGQEIFAETEKAVTHHG
jgi:cell division septal protein FtsQ